MSPVHFLALLLRFGRAALLLVAACVGASPALTHEMRPAFLELREENPGEFSVTFKTPMQGDFRLALSPRFSGAVENLTPVVSRATGDAMVQTWRIAAIEPLAGQKVSIEGLSQTMTDALVRIEFADGGTWVERLTPSAPDMAIPATQNPWEVAATYFRHGIEHIASGIDHLLFVAALMLIVRGWRRIVETITAFTVAHSITLTLATIGWITLPSAPVEAMIALSILLVATEIVRMERGQSSLTIRWPWVVAFAFGLLHGFGFAGALVDLGLPRGDVPLALLSFNIGVEIGQLLFIAAILLAVHSIRRIITIPRRAIVASAYVIGTVAAFWSIERLDAMFL
ncbi:MAG: HupE/UreJ family protein [Mesorhizobium sp.]|nr:MAG: HupE/UreJ family protein [Mesorhizobium sp.]